MKYSVLADTYVRLEKVSSKLEKTRIVAELLKETHVEILSKVVLLLDGRVFPPWSGEELGVKDQLILRSIQKAYGVKADDSVQAFKKTGDLGSATELFASSKKQVTLGKKELSIDKVFSNLQDLAKQTGEGSQERKLSLIAELLSQAQPIEARYIIRTILYNLRVGVAEGLIRDAIVNAFLLKDGTTKEDKAKLTEIVEYALNILSDFGEVAKIAKEKGIEGLRKVRPELGKPIQVMLAEKAESIEEPFEEFKTVIIETKYDGARIQCHKKGDKIWLYTRRLENVTNQFPDLVELCKKGLKAGNYIIEGEVLAINPKTGRPMPFQRLSQRIHRKYDIEKMIKEIPIQMNIFDVLYLDGKIQFDKPLKERRKILEKIVKKIPEKFQLAKKIITDDPKKAEEFYQMSLKSGQEGIMIKVVDSPYVFGRHVGGWYKIKPIMETLDLVVVGATWGEGKRSKWLSSYMLACRDPDTGKFLRCGMMSTGLTEKEYDMITKTLKPLIVKEIGKDVVLKPKIVVETGYQEIQKSTNYESGFALRFPRLVRIRDDRGPDDADTIERLAKLYESQGREG